MTPPSRTTSRRPNGHGRRCLSSAHSGAPYRADIHPPGETSVDHQIEDLKRAIQELEDGVDEIDTAIRGDGNGTPGLAARVRNLETQGKDTERMIREWNEWKASWKGVKWTLVGVGAVLAVLGGGMGAAILSTLGKIAASLP